LGSLLLRGSSRWPDEGQRSYLLSPAVDLPASPGRPRLLGFNSLATFFDAANNLGIY
jgi:hypothetical protein